MWRESGAERGEVGSLGGDVIGILDNSGNLLVSYTYTAYGVPTTSFPGITSSMTDAQKQEIYILGSNNPFRYRGYYFDTETGFYYLNSRYYDPVTGRFLNADGYASTGQGVLGQNMFAYCLNNPIAYEDSTGTCRMRADGEMVCKYDTFLTSVNGGPCTCGDLLNCTNGCIYRLDYANCVEQFKAWKDYGYYSYANYDPVWPANPDNLGCQFNCNRPDCNDHNGIHTGIDIGPGAAVNETVIIYAPYSGEISKGHSEGLGNFVKIKFENYYGEKFSIYLGHLESVTWDFGTGSYVEAGAAIGIMGNTGVKSTGKHLHVSITKREDGTFYYDPIIFNFRR